jgi:hypothetical protein
VIFVQEYVFTDAEKQMLRSEGAMVALEKLEQRNPNLSRQLHYWRSGWLGSWMVDNIKEAETEVDKLQAAVKRLKQDCLAIKQANYVSATDPKVTQFKNDLDAVDGWTISLLETVLRIVTFMDTKKGNAKVQSLNTAMQSLMAKRVQEMEPFLKDPSLFKNYMG